MRHTLGWIIGLALAAILSQAPEFSKQYEQRLGGAVAELRIIVADFDAAAQKAGLSRAEALQTYRDTNSPFLVDRGTDMQRLIARYQRLDANLLQMQDAGALQRLMIILGAHDGEITTGALTAFAPALPLTLEGLIFALIGLLGGHGAVRAGSYLRTRARRRHPAAPEQN